MLLLSTASLAGYGLHRIFHFAKQAEYAGIDLSVDFGLFDTIHSAYLSQLVQETGVKIISITAPERQVTTSQIEFCLELARELGVKILNVHPPHRLDKEKDWFWEHLKVLQSKYQDISINIINAPPKTWLFVIAEYGDARPETIKKMTDHTALSIANVDVNSGVDLMRTFQLLGSTLEFVYLSDKREQNEKLFLGEGLMPLESLLIKLRDAKYSGMFALNVDPDAIGVWSDAQVLANLEKAKKYLLRYFS